MTDNPVLKVLKQLVTTGPGPGKSQSSPAEPAFAAEGQLPLDALSFDVAGVGAFNQPLSPEQTQALHTTSTPAPHGQRERTVLDTRVRHSGEIAADHVALQWAPGCLRSLAGASRVSPGA